jgi:phosphatidylglycerophosphate synthase
LRQSNLNIPNLVTACRALFLPFFVYLISRPSQTSRILGFALFVFASLTDLIDGYLARRLNQETEFGKFLDPLADKLLVTGSLITMIFLSEQVQLWMVMCIVGRDVLITCLRYLAIYQGSSLRTSRLAKGEDGLSDVQHFRHFNEFSGHYGSGKESHQRGVSSSRGIRGASLECGWFQFEGFSGGSI